MPTNVLSDHKCRLAKPAEKPQKLFDGHGLYLYVAPAGSKTWRVAYRLDGKQQTETLGPYPLLTLAEARERRDVLRRKLLDGENPKRPKSPKVSVTLMQASEAFWNGRQDVTPGYRNDALRGIELHLGPALGKISMAKIDRATLLAALTEMDLAGKHAYVRKMRMWVSQVFDWAVEHGHAEQNPAALIRPEKAFGKTRRKSHASLNEHQVPDLLMRLSMEQELQSVLACRLLAYTWVRTNELRLMEWTEIHGDTWRIPAGKMKRAREHIVPLSRQALQVLEKMKAKGRKSRFVFPGENSLSRPMSENAVLYLIYRIGFKGQMTGHGWRSVASTWANERGYPPDAIERQLAHAPDDKTRAAYNQAEYLPQRRAMLQDFGDWLDEIDPSRSKG